MDRLIHCATRRDVADLAGVSETIVSYVMNGNRYVSQEKRERVLAAAKQLNYSPSNAALALRGKSSGQVLFIVDNPANERLSYLMSRMEQWGYEKKAVVTQCAMRNDPEFIRQMIRRRFDGIVISSMVLEESYIQEFVNAGIPTVLLMTRDYDHVHGAAKIGTGLYRGIRNAVQFLRSRGSSSFLYLDRISVRNHFSDMTDNRLRAFADSMEEIGCDWQERVVTGCSGEEMAEERIRELVLKFHADAIIGRNDQVACIALRQLKKMNLRIPEDIQVIGLDDSSVCRFVTPALSSIRLNDDGIAEATIDMIYGMRAGKSYEKTKHFEHQIIERESTRRLP